MLMQNTIFIENGYLGKAWGYKHRLGPELPGFKSWLGFVQLHDSETKPISSTLLWFPKWQI